MSEEIKNVVLPEDNNIRPDYTDELIALVRSRRPIAQLREEGLTVTGFWFNPNIHPYTEYQARKRTLANICHREQSKVATMQFGKF